MQFDLHGKSCIEATTSGTIYFDDFESRRFSYIGTLADPGVEKQSDPSLPSPNPTIYSLYVHSWFSLSDLGRGRNENDLGSNVRETILCFARKT